MARKKKGQGKSPIDPGLAKLLAGITAESKTAFDAAKVQEFDLLAGYAEETAEAMSKARARAATAKASAERYEQRLGKLKAQLERCQPGLDGIAP